MDPKNPLPQTSLRVRFESREEAEWRREFGGSSSAPLQVGPEDRSIRLRFTGPQPVPPATENDLT